MEALIATRAGEHAKALALITNRWPDVQGMLGGYQRWVLQAVELFCRERVSADEYRTSSDAAQRERLSAELRQATHGELDYLGAAWPDMADFIARHVGREEVPSG